MLMWHDEKAASMSFDFSTCAGNTATCTGSSDAAVQGASRPRPVIGRPQRHTQGTHRASATGLEQPQQERPRPVPSPPAPSLIGYQLLHLGALPDHMFGAGDWLMHPSAWTKAGPILNPGLR